MEELTSFFIHDIIDRDIENGFSDRIHTRFPPEPNGYLHIGSAKAIFIKPLYRTKNTAGCSTCAMTTQTP